MEFVLDSNIHSLLVALVQSQPGLFKDKPANETTGQFMAEFAYGFMKRFSELQRTTK